MAYYNASGPPQATDIDSVSRWLQTEYPGTYHYNNGAGSNTGKAQLAEIAQKYRINSGYGYYPDTTATNWTTQTALDNANQELQLGHPLIVGVQTYMGTHKTKVGHFMVLRGLDLTNSLAYFNDPGRSVAHQPDAENKSYPIDVFMAAWKSQNYAVVIIHPTSSNGPNELFKTALYTDPSLIAYYRFEGNSKDASSHGQNLIDANLPAYSTANGKFNQGVLYNGTNQLGVATLERRPSVRKTNELWSFGLVAAMA